MNVESVDEQYLHNFKWDWDEMVNDRIFCPKCNSDKIDPNKEGFNALKGTAGAVVGGALLGPLGAAAGGMLAGTAGQNRIYLTCLTCGHQFPAGNGKTGHAEAEFTKELKPKAKKPHKSPKINW